MRVQYLALACLISTSALAQQPTDHVKIDVTRAELQLIGQGLMELPYKASAPVLNDLQAQLNAADLAAAKAVADEKKAEEKPADKPEDAAAKQ